MYFDRKSTASITYNIFLAVILLCDEKKLHFMENCDDDDDGLESFCALIGGDDDDDDVLESLRSL